MSKILSKKPNLERKEQIFSSHMEYSNLREAYNTYKTRSGNIANRKQARFQRWKEDHRADLKAVYEVVKESFPGSCPPFGKFCEFMYISSLNNFDVNGFNTK